MKTLNVIVASLKKANMLLQNPEDFGSIISISDPKKITEPNIFSKTEGASNQPINIEKINHLRLLFHDISLDDKINDNFVLVNETHIKQIIEFTKTIDRNKNILIHCDGGICRSSAVALIVGFILFNDISESFRKVLKFNKHIYPNSLVINLGDKLLKLDGKLITFTEKVKNSFDIVLRKKIESNDF